GLKVGGQALVVVGAGLVDHSGLGVAQLVGGVIGHLHALERVGEGGAEHVGVDGVGLGVVGDGLGGSGCGDHGHIVVLGLSHNGQGGGGGDIADQSGGALVHHLGKGGDSLCGVALLVHLDDLDLLAVDAAGLVDLLDVQVGAVGHGDAVDRHVAGQGGQQAHLDGVAGGGAGSCARCGSGSGRAGGAGRRTAGGQCAHSGGSAHNSQELTAGNTRFHT